jgi:hypothetical protein
MRRESNETASGKPRGGSSPNSPRHGISGARRACPWYFKGFFAMLTERHLGTFSDDPDQRRGL